MEIIRKILWAAGTLLVLGVFTLLVFDKIVMPLVVKQGRNVRVPDVVELQADTARVMLEKDGFQLIVDREEYDQDVDTGAIISQNPPAFSITKKGRRIHVVASIGARMVKMTDLTGVSLRQARIFLREMELEEGKITRMYFSKYPRNVVVKQSVPPDSLVPKGIMVDLTVSVK